MSDQAMQEGIRLKNNQILKMVSTIEKKASPLLKDKIQELRIPAV